MRCAPTVYRVAAICVFLMGVALHLTNVIIGPDRLVAEVFSPGVEIVFSFGMIVAAASGWLSLKRLMNRGAMRVVFWFALVMITLSIPIHLRSAVSAFETPRRTRGRRCLRSNDEVARGRFNPGFLPKDRRRRE